MSEQTNAQGDDAVQVDDPAQTPGMKAARINANPAISLEEARNAAAGEGENASGSVAPSTVEENVPSTSDPNATDIPSSDNH
ncbi:MAG TPA: hypothetical protein V6D10_11060 [Trichocoleus sp.]